MASSTTNDFTDLETDSDLFKSTFRDASTTISIVMNDLKENYKNKSLYANCTSAFPKEVNCSISVYLLYPSDIIWFGAICCILFSIFGSTGNLISILALLKCKRLRNPTTAFIINLCVSDMLFCCFTMPLTAVTFIDRKWNNGPTLCKLFALVKFTNGIASVFTIIAVTLNRYVLIIHPELYPVIYRRRNIGIIIASLWLAPLSLISLPLFDVWGTLTYNPKVGDCGVMNLNGKSPRSLIFAVAMILPIIVFIASYLRIYFHVRKSIKSVQKQNDRDICENFNSNCQKNNYDGKMIHIDLRDKKEFRVLRIALAVFIVHLVSTFPIGLIKLLRKESELPVMNILAYVFFFSSSVVNPIIYIVMSREYRIAYQELFRMKN